MIVTYNIKERSIESNEFFNKSTSMFKPIEKMIFPTNARNL